MTLIARIPFRKLPILVGDLLATSDNDQDRYSLVALPSMADPNQKLRNLGSPFFIHGLVQKINRLSDSFYVAVAGDEIHIRNLLQKLQLIAHDTDLSFEKVRRMINAIDYCDRSRVQAIGLGINNEILSGENKYWCFDYKVDRYVSQYFGEVSIAGSGYRQLSMLLEEITQTARKFDDDPTSTLEFGYLLQSFMAGFDIIDARNILSRWGGGLEVVTFDTEKVRFIKQNNITHIFAIARVNDRKIKLKLFPKVVYQCYVGDILLQHIVECQNVKNGSGNVTRNDLLYAKPILHDTEVNISKIAQHVNNEDSRHVCCHVAILGHKDLSFHTHPFHNDAGEPWFSYAISRDNKFFYKLSPTVFEKVRAAIYNELMAFT